MRISMFYLVPAGLFAGFIGLILTLIGLGARAWLKTHRPDSAHRWVGIPMIFSIIGELLEFLGLFFLLMAAFNTITLRLHIIIESQFLLTLYLVIVPILLSGGVVRGFNHMLHRWFIRDRHVTAPESSHES